MFAGALQDLFDPMQLFDFRLGLLKLLLEACSYVLDVSFAFRIQKQGDLL